MPTLAGQLGAQAAGIGMGLLLEKHNDRRQRKQQEALGNIQLGLDKKMTDYSYKKQMEMWEATNYHAQMEQLKKAGLNPGLIYGMGGAGGATTGGGAASSHGANAPIGGGESIAMMGMGIQSGLMQAQIENIKADTEKKKVEAGKIGTVDIEEANTRIASLKQGMTNAKAIEAMTRVETKLKELDVELKGKTLQDSADIVKWTANRLLSELEIAQNEAYISNTTVQDKVKIIGQSVIEAFLRNEQLRAQTKNTAADTQLKGAQIGKIASDIQVNNATMQKMVTDASAKLIELTMQNRGLDIKAWETQFNAIIKEFEANQPGLGAVLSRLLSHFLNRTKGILE